MAKEKGPRVRTVAELSKSLDSLRAGFRLTNADNASIRQMTHNRITAAETRIEMLEKHISKLESNIEALSKRDPMPHLLFKHEQLHAAMPKVPVSDFVVEAPEAKDLFDIGCELGKLAARVEEMRKRKR